MRPRIHHSLCLGFAAALIALTAGTAQAAIVSGPNNCSFTRTYSWMGDAHAADVEIPSQARPDGISSYEGTILRPADTAAYPGPRPLVVLQHGLGGSECGLWWAAQDLAGHGFVTMVWTAPTGSTTVASYQHALDATRSAIAFARSQGNPFLGFTDANRTAVAGHSLGAVVTSYIQGEPDPGVKAAVAYDSLRRWLLGDPGAAREECLGNPLAEVTPRVPALGFAMDLPCSAKPDFAPPDLKHSAFLHWRDHDVPSMSLVMAGYSHGSFSAGGAETQLLDLAHYTRAWLDRWLLDDRSAVDRLLAQEVNGRPTSSILSTQFLSGAFLGERIDTDDYLGVLNDSKGPKVKRLRGPDRRISRDEVRRHGLRFTFSVGEDNVRFECRLDDGDYAHCDSPKRYERASLGRHTFRVRAIDEGNNRGKSATSKFRVVRAG